MQNKCIIGITLPDPGEDINRIISQAKHAEIMGIDFIFSPSGLVLHLRNMYKSVCDPTLRMTAIATHTQKIGLVTTISTSFNPPYVVAYQLQSLNWISNGRIGVNWVTSLDGNENFGLDSMPSSPERYAKAESFVSLVRKLWDSHSLDSHHPIHYKDSYFQVAGPLNIAQKPDCPIPFFQAGASPSGRAFCAKIANCAFTAMPDIYAGIELRNSMRTLAQSYGRNPDVIRVLPGVGLYLAKTRKQAYAVYNNINTKNESEKFDNIIELLDIDMRLWDKNRVVTLDMIPDTHDKTKSLTHSNLLRSFIEREHPTVWDILMRPEVVSNGHWVVIGTPDDAVDAILDRWNAGAMDGFIAVPQGGHQSFTLFLDKVVPKLMKKGIYNNTYTGKNLWEYLQ